MQTLAIISEASKPRCILLLWLVLLYLPHGQAMADSATDPSGKLPVLQQWIGDYPLGSLGLLPDQQRESAAGLIDDIVSFRRIWQAFRPAAATPSVDFESHIVVFHRNTRHYGRTEISKVLLQDGVLEVLAVQAIASNPVDDKVAMALAVIPWAPVTALQIEGETLLVDIPPDGADPLNTSYRLEGAMVRLRQGHAEAPVAAGSVSSVRTSVLAEPARGDLDGDDDEDVALILINSGGGSGSFYYAAVAHNVQGGYRGSNAVWLGDRIAVRDVSIAQGMLIVRYLDREAYEPMTVTPTVPKTVILYLDNGTLEVRARFGDSEQLLEGRLIIGHEVRSFIPCGQELEHWLMGSPAVLDEIMVGYRERLGDDRAYAPLFAVLVGHVSEPPSEGFGAGYPAAIVATRLVGTPSDGQCAEESQPKGGE